MKIVSAAVSMDSSHVSLQTHELKESLRAWVGNRRPDFEGSRQRPALSPSSDHARHLSRVAISDAGKVKQSREADAIDESLQAAENDPVLRLIRDMIARLTGQEVRVFDARKLRIDDPAPQVPDAVQAAAGEAQPARQAAGYGVEYDRHESYTEFEQTTFNTSGTVVTSDGKEINFDLSLSMSRAYHEESDVSIRLGDARQKQDPLVINFNGSSAQLTDHRFAFDLNADGQAENINFVTSGSGFLVIDRNADGKINDGSELFGARSGNGFAELAALDADHNGWIDENDAAYDQLLVWTKDAAGNDRLASLRKTNVGAISLARVETPFDLKNAGNELQGQVRSSGIFLTEEGQVGTVQQVDLTV